MTQWGVLRTRSFFCSTMILLAVILLTAACSAPGADSEEKAEQQFELDPTFREIYLNLGGEAVLGRPISPLMVQDDVKLQFVENALLRYNSTGPDTQRYQLEPIGVRMGLQDPPVAPPNTPGLKYINQFVIFPDFVGFYESHFGDVFFGKPISTVHYNPLRKRYEQYFENVALYRKVGDPAGKVGLLAYGTAVCGENCIHPKGGDSTLDVAYGLETPFHETLDRLTTVVTGFPLTGAYTSSDGMIEQVFENVVLVTDPADLGKVALRTLSQVLNVQEGNLEDPNGDPAYHFVPVDGEKGYNIRMDFWEFLQAHGGLELSGAPVTGMIPRANQRLRQCFEKLCLVYDENLPEGYRLGVEPIGYTYWELFSRNGIANSESGSGGIPRNLILNTWEKHESLRPGEIQEIFTSVIDGDTPLVGVQPVLDLTLPNGQLLSYIFPRTDANGQSSLPLPQLDGRSYTLVPYQVCLSGENPKPKCKADTFIIVDNQ